MSSYISSLNNIECAESFEFIMNTIHRYCSIKNIRFSFGMNTFIIKSNQSDTNSFNCSLYISNKENNNGYIIKQVKNNGNTITLITDINNLLLKKVNINDV